MPTAKPDPTVICECGHGQHTHEGGGRCYAGRCSCSQFRRVTEAKLNLKEGEAIRRITED